MGEQVAAAWALLPGYLAGHVALSAAALLLGLLVGLPLARLAARLPGVRLPALGFAIVQGALLHQLGVARAANGSGAAAALVDAAKARASGGLALEVNQDNPRAVRFYLREGFRRTGEGRNAGSGLATWHMRWP